MILQQRGKHIENKAVYVQLSLQTATFNTKLESPGVASPFITMPRDILHGELVEGRRQ